MVIKGYYKTGTSLSDCLVSYPGYSLEGGVLLFCRDAISVFYSPAVEHGHGKKLKEIFRYSFTAYEKTIFKGVSTNGKTLEYVCRMARRLFWRQLTFQSFFVLYLSKRTHNLHTKNPEALIHLTLSLSAIRPYQVSSLDQWFSNFLEPRPLSISVSISWTPIIKWNLVNPHINRNEIMKSIQNIERKSRLIFTQSNGI